MRNGKANMRRSAHSSKYRYLLSPPQRPLCVMGRLGRKKQKARGERVPRAHSIFSIVAFVIGIPRSLCGGKSVYLCKQGGCHTYARTEKKLVWLEKTRLTVLKVQAAVTSIRLDAFQADPSFLLLIQKDKRQLCLLGGYRTAKRLCKYTVVFMTSLSWSSDRGRLYRKCILQHALASLKGSALK